jgi:hypothetical protein
MFYSGMQVQKIVVDGLRILTHLSKGLVDDFSHFKVKLGIDIAHERFVMFELASHNREMSVLVSILCRVSTWKERVYLALLSRFPSTYTQGTLIS